MHVSIIYRGNPGGGYSLVVRAFTVADSPLVGLLLCQKTCMHPEHVGTHGTEDPYPPRPRGMNELAIDDGAGRPARSRSRIINHAARRAGSTTAWWHGSGTGTRCANPYLSSSHPLWDPPTSFSLSISLFSFSREGNYHVEAVGTWKSRHVLLPFRLPLPHLTFIFCCPPL